MDEVPVFFLVTGEFEAIGRQERRPYEPQRLGRIRRLRLGLVYLASPGRDHRAFYGTNRVIFSSRGWEADVPYLKPVLAGLLASAIVYLCFLTWLALEGCLSGQAARSDGPNRCHGCVGLRTAFAVVLGTGDHFIRSCLSPIS